MSSTTTTLTGINVLSAGTSTAWNATNQPISNGVYLIETDTGKSKVGDGVHLYSALPYHVNTLGGMGIGNGLVADGSGNLTINPADTSLNISSSGAKVNTNNLTYPVNALGTVSTGTVTFNRSATSWEQLTVGGAITIAITGWPATGVYAELNIQLINGGSAAITWPTISWKKTDGSGTYATTPTLAGITFQSAGTDWVKIWSVNGGTTFYAEVKR